jgi:uncharacterized membrane protein
MVSGTIAVLFILATVVFISIRLEARYRVFRSLGAALVSILLAMVLSNVGLLSDSSPAYGFLVGPGVSAGVVLILLSVDLGSVRKAGPVMLKAFAVGAVGTAVGSMLMATLLSESLGPETWKLSGQFTGTYTGGGMNFAALGQALGTSSDLFSAAIAADVLVTAIWLVACLAAPVILSRNKNNSTMIDQQQAVSRESGNVTIQHSLYTSGQPIELFQMAAMAAIAIGTLWLSGVLADWISFLPNILWLTSIVLILAQIPAIKKLSGGAMLGNYLLLLFLASNGAQSVVANIIRQGPAVFYFAVGTVAIHGLAIFGVGRLLGIHPGTLAVASQANVGGPASAMALASARGYPTLFLPGVAVGLLGYAIGNYLGLAIATLMKDVL